MVSGEWKARLKVAFLWFEIWFIAKKKKSRGIIEIAGNIFKLNFTLVFRLFLIKYFQPYKIIMKHWGTKYSRSLGSVVGYHVKDSITSLIIKPFFSMLVKIKKLGVCEVVDNKTSGCKPFRPLIRVVVAKQAANNFSSSWNNVIGSLSVTSFKFI